jgi:short-subunit dehydrogenase
MANTTVVPVDGLAAYVSGAGSGIGRAMARRLSARGTGVRAATVHPGGVKTNIARNARFHAHPDAPDMTHEQAADQFEKIARTTPERAAEIIHRGVKAGKSRILVGPDAYMFDTLARIAPSRCFDVLDFIGRKLGRHRQT